MHVTRPRWVIAELDVNGEIDDHAVMCLGFAIEGARELAPDTIIVDLRELSAIDDDGLGLFVAHDAACRAEHVQLAILVCADRRQEAIVTAFVGAGLGDRLRFSQPLPPAPPEPEPAKPVVRAMRVSARRYRRPATARR
jgi:anti-anti-sigma regulatory factor